MKTYKWIAYGKHMLGYLIVEVKGDSVEDSFSKTLKLLKKHEINYDAVKLFDNNFLKRMNWIN